VPGFVAIVIAVLALALAMAACSRPTPAPAPAAPPTPQFTEQQVAEAKQNLCDAYKTMFRAIEKAGTVTSEDPNERYMLALNIRLAFNTAADYLLGELSQNPAAPSDLIDATRQLARSYQRMVLTQTARAPQEDLDAVYREADPAEAAIKRDCQ
jgi:hypothetical protein